MNENNNEIVSLKQTIKNLRKENIEMEVKEKLARQLVWEKEQEIHWAKD